MVAVEEAVVAEAKGGGQEVQVVERRPRVWRTLASSLSPAQPTGRLLPPRTALPIAAPAHHGLDGLGQHLPGGVQVTSQPLLVQLQLAAPGQGQTRKGGMRCHA